jgi:hypothetical protein
MAKTTIRVSRPTDTGPTAAHETRHRYQEKEGLALTRQRTIVPGILCLLLAACGGGAVDGIGSASDPIERACEAWDGPAQKFDGNQTPWTCFRALPDEFACGDGDVPTPTKVTYCFEAADAAPPFSDATQRIGIACTLATDLAAVAVCCCGR